MGACFSRKPPIDYENEDVNFNHFKLLRAVGKGSFGKVCIVMKRDTKKLYAMKYMSKEKILAEKALKNVYNERKILESLNFPLIVNLWFAFQDAEDMFMVVDLMLGGDLRYHLQRYGPFSEERVLVHVAEASVALQYIHSMGIVHRDIKPDNMLLDGDGHVHLADFNVASYIPDSGLLRSRAGTRPYMAPEMITGDGYTSGVDWWSLGVTMFELMTGKNPFRSTNIEDVNDKIVNMSIPWPNNLSGDGLSFMQGLLERDPALRLGTPNNMEALHRHPWFSNLNCPWEEIGLKKLKPAFVPDKDKINCDAMYELEEIMLEENPLYRKRERLKKEEQRRKQSQDMGIVPGSKADLLQQVEKDYRLFNRERLLKSGAGLGQSAMLSLSRLREMQSGNLILDESLEDSAASMSGGEGRVGMAPNEPPIPEESSAIMPR